MAPLAINPNTVLKASPELETKGCPAGRLGRSTFIENHPRLGRIASMDGSSAHLPPLAGRCRFDGSRRGRDHDAVRQRTTVKPQIRAANRHCVTTRYDCLGVLWEFTMARNPETRICRRPAPNYIGSAMHRDECDARIHPCG